MNLLTIRALAGILALALLASCGSSGASPHLEDRQPPGQSEDSENFGSQDSVSSPLDDVDDIALVDIADLFHCA